MKLQIVKNYNGISYYKERIKAAKLSGWEEFAAEVVMDSISELPRNVELEASTICASVWLDIDRGCKPDIGTAIKSLVDRDLLPLIWIRKRSDNHQVYRLL
jgi:hypothetical protein